MRAVQRSDSGVVTLEVADPVPGDDDVVVTVTAAGICGSDLHALGMGPSPIVFGHEIGGVLDDGTPVAVSPCLTCGDCPACRRGEEQLCADATARLMGFMVDGGMAERVAVRESNVLRLPAGTSPGAAALVEPVSIAVHATNRIDPEPGMRVLVVGAGAIGLTMVLALRARGIDVDITARYDHQAAAAEALGASRVHRADADTAGSDYDVVVDSIGNQSAIDESLARVRRGGRILEVGGFWEPVSIGLLTMVNEIDIISAVYSGHHHGESEFAAAAELLTAHADAADVLVTHRFPLEEAGEAFRTAGDKSSGAIKVHLHP